MTRIVQVANAVTPHYGGLRTTLQQLAAGYAAAGHEVVQVLPGPRDAVEDQPWGCRVTLAAPQLPGSGYRVLRSTARVRRAVGALEPERLEIHDRTTLRGLGRWAREQGVPSLVVTHERLDRWLQQRLSRRLPLETAADRANAALADGFDTVVCTTSWAAAEFTRLGVPVQQVPLGVDLEVFRPDRSSRPWLAGDREVLLVTATRLSKGGRPDLAVRAAAELHRRGVPARLVVVGDGPMRSAVERTVHGLPVVLAGVVDDRRVRARLLGAADVVLAPGPEEAPGLAALEALACGTPVIANWHSALPSVVDSAGLASAQSPWSFANAVEQVLAVDEEERRALARRRAEQFPWSATVAGFLAVHGLRACPPGSAGRGTPSPFLVPA